MTFIFTSCSDTCPLLTAKLVGIQRKLAPGDPVFFVEITVDPLNDSPAVLKKYAEAFAAPPSRFAFLTGDFDEIHKVVRSYGVYYKQKEKGGIDHTFLTSIVDPSGTLRVQYLGSRFDPNEFLGDLRSLLRGGARQVRKLTDWLPDLVARTRASVFTKLLVAFLTIVALMLVAGLVGLRALSEVNKRAEDMVQLQRKIAAYRQLNHDTIGQLYSVASSLLKPDERRLEATLRQLNQFGYDLDRLQFVAQDEKELFARVRKDYEEFIQVVTQVVELIRSGRTVGGTGAAAHPGHAACRPARAPHQRAGEQGRGRHGRQHRGEPSTPTSIRSAR